MAYYPDEPQRPKDPPTEIAKGLALMAGGGAAAWLAGDAGLPPLWWWLAVACGIAAAVGGLAYAASIALEWIAFSWPSWQAQNGERPSGDNGRPDTPEGDTETVEAVGRGANGHTTQPDMLLDQLRIRLQQEVDWFDRIDWHALATYVATEPEPQFSRVALVPIVPARVYSRYNEEDITFPEAMVWMGMAQEIETNNYQWTGRGKRIMREIYNDFQRDLSPTPTAAYEN